MTDICRQSSLMNLYNILKCGFNPRYLIKIKKKYPKYFNKNLNNTIQNVYVCNAMRPARVSQRIPYYYFFTTLNKQVMWRKSESGRKHKLKKNSSEK